MAKVLQLDCTNNLGEVALDLSSAPYAGAVPEIWAEFDIAVNATWITDATASGFSQTILEVRDSSNDIFYMALLTDGSGGFTIDTSLDGAVYPLVPEFAPSPTITSNQLYHFKVHILGDALTPTIEIWKDGAVVGSFTGTGDMVDVKLIRVRQDGMAAPGALQFYDNFALGTTDGGTDLATDDFESGIVSASIWNDTITDATVVDDPGLLPAVPSGGSGTFTGQRVMIAFDDGPLEPSPTWTPIDGGADPFPQNFVSGYDLESGRQTLISQTDTGTATVYINDHELALFDPRNVLSPYFGKLDGRQIKLQLWDPEAETWNSQFRGLIDNITWEIDGSAVGADGKPINASIQIECVDMFDYLAGYGLTPGLDGITPRVVPSGTAGGPVPVGFEDGVYYAQTVGTVDDRIIEILTDAGIDSTRYTVASGNVSVQAVKYDPDEAALQALRDAADAEIPFIANIYCDRHGDFLFRGRYSRFDPDDTAAEPGSTWDFQRWFVGDGPSIVTDPTRAQIKTFAFGRNRSELINVAICYPQNMPPADMPNQVFANTTSITAYGKHSAPPMSDLITHEGSTTGSGFTTTANQECYLFAKLLVTNQKDPRENVTTLGLKSIRPDGTDRSQRTWALLTRADISHIVNVDVGYPAGTGLAGDSPQDDYYIEGRKMQVRPLNPTHDYVELELAVSPAVWSMDLTGVFPPFPGPAVPELTADFTVAE